MRPLIADESAKPTMSLDQILDLAVPAKKACGAFIYFLIRSGEVVYVGQTTQFEFRLATHMKSKDFDSYSRIEVDPSDLDRLEAEYILSLRPPLNRSLPASALCVTEAELKRRWGWARVRRAKNCGALVPHRFGGQSYYRSTDVSECEAAGAGLK